MDTVGKNKKAIEQNIVRRIDRRYSDLSIKDCYLMDLNHKKSIVEDILNSEDEKEFFINIVNNLNEDWLLEQLYSMDMDICKTKKN